MANYLPHARSIKSAAGPTHPSGVVGDRVSAPPLRGFYSTLLVVGMPSSAESFFAVASSRINVALRVPFERTLP